MRYYKNDDSIDSAHTQSQPQYLTSSLNMSTRSSGAVLAFFSVTVLVICNYRVDPPRCFATLMKLLGTRLVTGRPTSSLRGGAAADRYNAGIESIM